MQGQRKINRILVDIPVVIATVLDTMEAQIADITEHGILIRGAGLPEGTHFRIEYCGQTVFAQCRWSEVDRMGAKFLFELVEGPLYERLMMAAGTSHQTQPQAKRPAGPANSLGRPRFGMPTFARTVAAGGFGRRS
jgi:hypothetical protein